MPKFSILMPTWNRANILPNTIRSVLNQTYTDFELLVGDDGSTDHTPKVLANLAAQDSRIKIFRHETPRERVITRKELLKEAQGEWIYWIDSDDEIIYGALEILAKNIEENPEYKMFNFGQVIYTLRGTDIKYAQDLPDWQGEGMYHFDTGLVGAGGFCFHRDCIPQVLENWPDVDNCFDLADWFGTVVDQWFDKNDPGKEHQKYSKDEKWCGNPWGDDYTAAWLISRKYKSKKLPINPYIAYIRTENWAYERADNSGTMGWEYFFIPSLKGT